MNDFKRETYPQPLSSYWNYRTEQYDSELLTADNAKDYIPQIPAAQNLYDVYIKMGRDYIEASILVHKAVLGMEAEI